MGWINDIYEKLKNKFNEEKEEYNNSTGLSAYIASNMTSIAIYTSEALGKKELAQKIEAKREDMIKIGQAIDDKVKEEYQQYQESDGFNQYVAGNVVTLAREGAKAIGEEELAQKIEAKREDIIKVGKAIDDKVKEEYQQYQESDGFSQYVAGNVVTLAKKGAEAIGEEEWAQKIEDNREKVLDNAKKLDDKVKEEYQQYQESDGFSQYVAGNVITLAKKGAEAIGEEELAQKIEANREKILNNAQKLDDKVKEEYQQYQESNGLGEYFETNISTLVGKSTNDKTNTQTKENNTPKISLNQNNEEPRPNIDYVLPQNNRDFAPEIERDKISPPKENGKLSIIKEKDSERTLYCSMVDGAPHGASIEFGKDGKIIDCKLFNHGKEINLDGKNLKINTYTDDKGREYCETLLDNQKFGWEMTKDKDGSIAVKFYDETGELTLKNIKISEDIHSKQKLASELKNMQGSSPQLTGQYAIAQAKYDLNLHNNHSKENQTPHLEPKTTTAKSLNKLDEKLTAKLIARQNGIEM